MQHLTKFRNILKRKARIYGWLLVGLVPTWACGPIERYEGPDSALVTRLQLISSALLVASLWIVLWRWETIEQRRMARRVRILLFAVSVCAGFAVFGTFVQWCAGVGHGTYLPVVLSSAPLSAPIVMVRLCLGSASALGPASGAFKTLTMSLIVWGTPIVWGTMAVLAASPRTRRRMRLFLGTMLSHYLVGVMAIVSMTAGHWQSLSGTWHEVPWLLTGWVLTYGGAHVLLWRSFLKNRTKKDSIATVTVPVASAPSALDLSKEPSDVHDDALSLTRS
jgi:hypothetical protein